MKSRAYSENAPVILTIAGSDSSGGAGIQADLKTMLALGCYGCSVITAVTAQNTFGVDQVRVLKNDIFRAQLEAVLNDLEVDAIKIGMLGSKEIVGNLLNVLKNEKTLPPLILDPVIYSKTHAKLLEDDAIGPMKNGLFPLSYLITPNIDEALILTKRSRKPCDVEGVKELARELKAYGARYVLITGGHLEGKKAIDVLFDGYEYIVFESKRIDTLNTHGTGCTLSSAIASHLALGDSVVDSIARAKRFIEIGLKSTIRIGKGTNPVNHLAYLNRELIKYDILERLKKCYRLFESMKLAVLIPEVMSNLVEALPYAQGVDDVAGFPGRIVKVKNKIHTAEGPEFGGSSHLARFILAIMCFFPGVRSVMNIAYSSRVVEICKDLGFDVGDIERPEVPREIEQKEGYSLTYIAHQICDQRARCPDVIYDTGDTGKEAMMRILGKDANDVSKKVGAILAKYD